VSPQNRRYHTHHFQLHLLEVRLRQCFEVRLAELVVHHVQLVLQPAAAVQCLLLLALVVLLVLVFAELQVVNTHTYIVLYVRQT
jgi:hypothetical protein